MKQAQCVVAKVFLMGLGFLVVAGGAPGCGGMAPESGIEARSVPGAPSQQGQMLTFPQKFDVRGQEVDSFGFAVTQPGPITIDVQAQGAPVNVTLQGLASPPIAQQGTGRVHLIYQVTPQDVQKSALWAVKVKLVQPGVPPQGGQASGTVMVQHPPADPAVVQAQLTALQQQEQANHGRFAAEAEARNAAAFQQFKIRFEQQQQQRQAAERAQNQPIVDQVRGKTGSPIRSRGLEGESAATEGSEVTTRGTGFPTLGPLSPTATAPLTVAPQQGSLTIAPPPPAPTPVIDHLNKTQGQPKDQVIIYGKNFGNAGGDVVFQLGPSTALPGTVEAWSDTVIVADVPDASGLVQFDGGVFVPMGQIKSNTTPFRFIPAQEVRVYHSAKGDVSLAQPGSYTAAAVPTGWDHFGHPNTTLWRLGGGKGNDIVFTRASLKNGWIVQDIQPYVPGCGLPLCQGVALADSRIGSPALFFNVRWWYEALHDSDYSFSIWIVGPRGVPDGLVMP